MSFTYKILQNGRHTIILFFYLWKRKQCCKFQISFAIFVLSLMSWKITFNISRAYAIILVIIVQQVKYSRTRRYSYCIN